MSGGYVAQIDVEAGHVVRLPPLWVQGFVVLVVLADDVVVRLHWPCRPPRGLHAVVEVTERAVGRVVAVAGARGSWGRLVDALAGSPR